ncbi:MAG: type II secretion system protein [bacterium]|nr:type II secretion system protein [bacterium]
MKPKSSRFNFHDQKGFSLIELVVVLAIFVFIIDVTTIIFISVVKQQKRILVEQELLSQGSYAIEYMSRSVRGAVEDETGVSCLGGAQYAGYFYLLTRYNSETQFHEGVKFITSGNVCKEFFLDGGVLKEAKSGEVAQPIISDKFIIRHAKFVINGDKSLVGASENDAVQPRLTMLLDVQSTAPDSEQGKIIQMTVSQRNLNEE